MDDHLIELILYSYQQNHTIVNHQRKPKNKVFVMRNWEEDVFIPLGFDTIILLDEFHTYPKRDNLFYFSSDILAEIFTIQYNRIQELENEVDRLEKKYAY